MTGSGLGGLIAAILFDRFVHPVSGAALGIFLLFFFVGMCLTIGYHSHFTHRS